MRLVLAVLMCVLITPSWAGEDPVYTSRFSNKALGGYDAVSYFSDAGPIKGDKNFKTTYNGADCLFGSEENLQAFLDAPDQFAPAYGGYCAWAVSQGYTAKGDPEQWSLVDGRLFLNYNAEIKQQWEANRNELIKSGDANWPKVLE